MLAWDGIAGATRDRVASHYLSKVEGVILKIRIHSSTVKSQIITSYYHPLSYRAIPTCKVLEFPHSCHIEPILSSISNYNSECSCCNEVILPNLECPLPCEERRKQVFFFLSHNITQWKCSHFANVFLSSFSKCRLSLAHICKPG